MTNEQREAVEFLEFYKQHCLKKEIENMDNYETIHDGDFVSKNLDTVLALIKEQQDKIAKYEKIYKEYDCYRWVKELDKKDKQIQELEEEKAMLKRASNIAKEVNIEDVTDVINKSCKEFMSNYIPKQAVIEALEDIEDYFDRLNGPDEDIEYIRQVKEELLEGGK